MNESFSSFSFTKKAGRLFLRIGTGLSVIAIFLFILNSLKIINLSQKQPKQPKIAAEIGNIKVLEEDVQKILRIINGMAASQKKPAITYNQAFEKALAHTLFMDFAKTNKIPVTDEELVKKQNQKPYPGITSEDFKYYVYINLLKEKVEKSITYSLETQFLMLRFDQKEATARVPKDTLIKNATAALQPFIPKLQEEPYEKVASLFENKFSNDSLFSPIANPSPRFSQKSVTVQKDEDTYNTPGDTFAFLSNIKLNNVSSIFCTEGSCLIAKVTQKKWNRDISSIKNLIGNATLW